MCGELAISWDLLPQSTWFAFDKHNGPIYVGPTEKQQRFYEHLSVVISDLDVVTTLVYRLQWQIKKFIDDKDFLSSDDMSVFLLADVHAFHAEFRSLMDSLCHVINIASSKTGQVPTESFNQLRKWCIQSGKRSEDALGLELSKLIAEAHWFLEIRDLRDRIIHRQSGAVVRCMNPPGEIAFTILKARSSELYEGPNAFLYNGWIYFCAHAGYYLGRLIFLLNQVCQMAAQNLRLKLNDVNWSTPRLIAAFQCINSAIKALELGFPLSTELCQEYPEEPGLCASLHEKISIRAYFLSLASKNQTDQLLNWCAAEREQLRFIPDNK